jgi:4-amino-4-deoxy-L-arabinose transferase-like glycosyltransferase
MDTWLSGMFATALLGLVIANLWWLSAYRSGLPFNIDEAGYLTEALHFGNAFHHVSFSGFKAVWTAPNSIGPLLPLMAGLIQGVTQVGPWSLLGVQQLFYLLAVLAGFYLARALMSQRMALLVAIVVASAPGLIDGGRLFYLAEPCAALFTLTVALLLRAAPFDSLRWSLLFGVVLGLTTLTRTVVLALIVAPVFVAVLQLVLHGLTKKRVRNLAAGFLLGFVLSMSWYFYTFHAVYSYLTDYGYKSEAGSYGARHSITSLSWWTSRLGNIVNQDLYALIVFVVVVVTVSGLLCRLMSRRGRTRSPSPLAQRVVSVLRAKPAVIGLTVVIDYLILSTSRNTGSYFELPLIAMIIALAFAALPAIRPTWLSAGIIGISILVSAANVADSFNLIPGSTTHSSVTLGGSTISVFNGSSGALSGPHLRRVSLGGIFWGNCGGATVTCFYGESTGATLKYIEAWDPASKAVMTTAFEIAGSHGRSAVVFFAYQGPLLNTNSVSLVAAEEHVSLPIGALQPVTRHSGSLHAQLEAPQHGQPNIVIAGLPPANGTHLDGPGSSAASLRATEDLLRREGFSLVRTMPLPFAQPIGFWWKNR